MLKKNLPVRDLGLGTVPALEPPFDSLSSQVIPIGSSFFMKGSISSLAADLGPAADGPAKVLGFMGEGLVAVVDGAGIDDFTVLGFFKPVEGLVSAAAGFF